MFTVPITTETRTLDQQLLLAQSGNYKTSMVLEVRMPMAMEASLYGQSFIPVVHFAAGEVDSVLW